ncbi:acyl carrier protein [Saccharothrix syringae]|uniref:Acyl carrier protein n=1 Tax=Saccharothrix syringae TaxID=103733 RepID=A0A5Q0H6U0_SACSY|nr:acyl carrier protein [Saccharothrix syringae]QFZ21432.1 acyl carrier protein [Saccharothrix syringae]
MQDTKFTLDDLRRVLVEGAGADEGVDLAGDILDVEFDDLGYDSIALLETASRISRESGVPLDDTVASAKTPRELLALINGG